MSRLGGARNWWFLPFAVVRRFRGHHAELLRRDVANARIAAETPFFAALAVQALQIGSEVAVAWRYERVGLEDYEAIAALVEDRLAAAATMPREPLETMIRREPLLRALSDAERSSLIDRARDAGLPATGRHGDFHMFNFCKSDARYVLLDWEHFDPNGSFALDYVEFAMSHQCFASGRDWEDFLAGRRARDPAVERMAGMFGACPDALWSLYLMGKLRAIGDRAGGFDRLPAARRARLIGVLRDHLRRTELPRSGPPDRAGARRGPLPA